MALLVKLRSFWIECIRVLKATKKPTNEEFKAIVKISGLGMVVIGLLGFVIQLLGLLIEGKLF